MEGHTYYVSHTEKTELRARRAWADLITERDRLRGRVRELEGRVRRAEEDVAGWMRAYREVTGGEAP